jgi:hypothetical protein
MPELMGDDAAEQPARIDASPIGERNDAIGVDCCQDAPARVKQRAAERRGRDRGCRRDDPHHQLVAGQLPTRRFVSAVGETSRGTGSPFGVHRRRPQEVVNRDPGLAHLAGGDPERVVGA